MEFELELKHLAPYLPYGLPIKILNHKCDYVSIEFAKANGFYMMADEFYVTYEGGRTGKGVNDFKPLLLPLSKLDKTFSVNGEEYHRNLIMDYFINSRHIFTCQTIIKNRLTTNTLKFLDAQTMFKFHFDVFGLIDAGLALNKLDYDET